MCKMDESGGVFMKNSRLPIEVTSQGIYCSLGEFYIDAREPVACNIITHAHADHAYSGHNHSIASIDSKELLEHRLWQTPVQTVAYGEKFKLGKTWVSLHPAGHILGSSLVRIETDSSVTVISGDYKRAFDPTCKAFEVIECDFFITETTFGLPIYQWQDSMQTAKEIYDWWQENSRENHTSIIFCYSLGKTQRLLALLAGFTDRTIYLHGAMMALTDIYKAKGIHLASYRPVSEKERKDPLSHELVLAPPSAAGSPWMKRFKEYRTAIASGWMQVRGTRKRKSVDRGFVLSDHADWPGLIQTAEETKATTIYTTHGNGFALAKYLTEVKGVESYELAGLHMGGEED